MAKPVANTAAIVRQTDDLDAYLETARREHEAGDQCYRDGLERYRRAGEALLKAKAAAGHGNWLEKLAKTGIPTQRASEYMRLAAGWHKLLAAGYGKFPPGGNFTLTLKEALAIIDAWKPDAKGPGPESDQDQGQGPVEGGAGAGADADADADRDGGEDQEQEQGQEQDQEQDHLAPQPERSPTMRSHKRPGRMDPREAASIGPRQLKDPRSPAFAWQTISLIKMKYQMQEISVKEWREILEEAERFRIYDKVPEGRPYGSLDALLLAEVGCDKEKSQTAAHAAGIAAAKVTGRVERQVPAFTKSLVGLALTANGRRLVAAGRDGEGDDLVRVYDAATGVKVREFGEPGLRIEQLAVRPDGGAVATTHPGRRVTLWDGDGKKVLELSGRGRRRPSWDNGQPQHLIGSVGIAPDGRWLAYSDQEQGVVVASTRSRGETGRAKPDAYYQDGAARYEVRDVLAFSPDGKTVAWSGVESTPDVFLIEARTGQVRRRLPGDSYPVRRLVFAPDGSRLLSAGPDGSALVWDVFGRPARRPAAAPPAGQVAGWWDRLADTDAGKAYAAMREMADHPKAAVALLREKLRPVKPVEPGRLDALVAGLDAPGFQDREAASRDLVALADAAEPRLRRLLRQSAALEVRRRAEDALDRIEGGRLRAERAVEVLEMIGDGAARALLRDLAGGMSGAARTADAAGALARTARR
jgi:hypothetical protein